MGMSEANNGSPMHKLAQAMRQHGLVRFVEHFKELVGDPSEPTIRYSAELNCDELASNNLDVV